MMMPPNICRAYGISPKSMIARIVVKMGSHSFEADTNDGEK